jgi:arsenite methyltransferase
LTSGLVFDEKTSRHIESLYAIPDMVRRRQSILRLLQVKPGERVIDIGTGPGFVSSEIGLAVGASGSVLGIDSSHDMLSLARERCKGKDWISLKKGEATQIPAPDNTFDAAVATQVFEYVDELQKALREVHRVLRSGGRALVLDTDFSTLVWRSSNQELTDRVLKAFEEHCARPSLPGILKSEMKSAGLFPTTVEVFVILDTHLSPERFSYSTIRLIENFVPGRNGLSVDDVARWAADIRLLGEKDEYFFSLNQYLFLAKKR